MLGSILLVYFLRTHYFLPCCKRNSCAQNNIMYTTPMCFMNVRLGFIRESKVLALIERDLYLAVGWLMLIMMRHYYFFPCCAMLPNPNVERCSSRNSLSLIIRSWIRFLGCTKKYFLVYKSGFRNHPRAPESTLSFRAGSAYKIISVMYFFITQMKNETARTIRWPTP